MKNELIAVAIIAVIFLFILSIAFQKYISTPKGRFNFDSATLKFPILGPLFQKVAVAKFSRTFSTLVKSGVAVLNALDIVGKTSGRKIILLFSPLHSLPSSHP